MKIDKMNCFAVSSVFKNIWENKSGIIYCGTQQICKQVIIRVRFFFFNFEEIKIRSITLVTRTEIYYNSMITNA